MSFSQLPAVEKDTKKWAAGKFLGPSYFEATLANERNSDHFINTIYSVHNMWSAYAYAQLLSRSSG